jgi:hypothetical protein
VLLAEEGAPLEEARKYVDILYTATLGPYTAERWAAGVLAAAKEGAKAVVAPSSRQSRTYLGRVAYALKAGLLEDTLDSLPGGGRGPRHPLRLPEPGHAKGEGPPPRGPHGEAQHHAPGRAPGDLGGGGAPIGAPGAHRGGAGKGSGGEEGGLPHRGQRGGHGRPGHGRPRGLQAGGGAGRPPGRGRGGHPGRGGRRLAALRRAGGPDGEDGPARPLHRPGGSPERCSTWRG